MQVIRMGERNKQGEFAVAHGAWSKHFRKRYTDARTREGKRLQAAIRNLTEEYGPDLSAAQCLLLDRIREKLIVLFQIGLYVDRQPSVVTSEGALLPCLGKGYTTYAESLRRDLEALAVTSKGKNKGPSLADVLKDIEAEEESGGSTG